MKRNLFIVLVAAVTSFVTVFLLNQKRQNKVLEELADLKRSIQLKNNTHFPIQEAGLPYTDNLDNAKMVSEGAQYGVQFYNQINQ